MDRSIKILDNDTILKKISRMAIQVKEEFFEENELVLLGIKGQGSNLLRLLTDELKKNKYFKKISSFEVEINKKEPWKSNPILPEKKLLENKCVLLVDDVLNSGKTVWYLFHHFKNIPLKSVRLLVLVDRNHLLFPVKADIAGQTLSTTLSGHIISRLDKKGEFSVFLK